jgi:hypothetical protein
MFLSISKKLGDLTFEITLVSTLYSEPHGNQEKDYYRTPQHRIFLDITLKHVIHKTKFKWSHKQNHCSEPL